MMAKRSGKVSECVWRVGCGDWGKQGVEHSVPGDCNVYLVDCGGEVAIVDTGGNGENPAILENIQAADFDARQVGKIFLTHAHEDHSQGGGWLRQETGGEICSGPVTARALSEGETNLMGGMEPFVPFEPVTYKVDRVLGDGETVSVGETTFTALHTPGHTIDSVCYLAERGAMRFPFGGDTAIGRQTRGDFDGYEFPFVFGWLDGHWSATLAEYRASLERLGEIEFDLLLGGHGEPNDSQTGRDALAAGMKTIDRVLGDPEIFSMCTGYGR